MARFRSWLPLSLVFLAGVALGVVGMATWVHTQLDALHAAGPEELDTLALHVLDRRLDLDATQEQHALQIVHQVHERLAAFHALHREELHAILRDAAHALHAILRPDQTTDWKELHERLMDHLLVSGLLEGHGAREH
jgi:hypothetical protein